MKKFALILFIFFLFSFLNAQIFTGNRAFNLSIEPAAAYTNGFLGEYFFRHYLEDKSKKESYLEWDKKLILYGAQFSLNYKRIHIDALFLNSVQNRKSGKMSDSDWKNDSDYSMKTTYSTGDNEACRNFTMEASLYFDFYPSERLCISPLVQVQYDYDSFACKESEGWKSDGKHWWYDENSTYYPRYNPQTGKREKLGEIDYNRKSLYTWTGFKVKTKLTERLSFDFSALASPYAYFYSLDTHWSQDKSTKEKFKKHRRQIQTAYFPAIKLQAKADFAINRIFDLTFSASGLFSLKITRGKWENDFYGESLQDGYYDTCQNSGSDMQYLSARIGLKIKIL